ncbi:MAG: hypothetical protein QM445_07750, partial [Thermotogota bacterium]|nr:hypothetical protein [Thermotogota bacterium]
MRRMKLVSVFLLVSLILLGGSVFSEVPEISLEEILKWTSAETNEDPYKRENMEVRGFYRDGEEYEDPQFYYFAASAASSREGDEPVEAVDGFYREGEEEEEYSIFISAFTSAPVDDIKVEAMKVFASTVNTLSGGDIYVRIFHTNNHSPEELLSN